MNGIIHQNKLEKLLKKYETQDCNDHTGRVISHKASANERQCNQWSDWSSCDCNTKRRARTKLCTDAQDSLEIVTKEKESCTCPWPNVLNIT